jgi:hypothetical protein
MQMKQPFLTLLYVIFLNANSRFVDAKSALDNTQRFSNSRLYYGTSLDDTYFQIEEMEDRDSSTTEVLLNRDETVGVLTTNGPPFVEASGKWRLKSDGTFQMTLFRTYESGQERRESSDMGVFNFVTQRSFVGQLSKIGAKQGIEGAMLDGDWYATDRKVGFFEMIDTTVGADGEVSLRGGVRSSW